MIVAQILCYPTFWNMFTLCPFDSFWIWFSNGLQGFFFANIFNHINWKCQFPKNSKLPSIKENKMPIRSVFLNLLIVWFFLIELPITPNMRDYPKNYTGAKNNIGSTSSPHRVHFRPIDCHMRCTLITFTIFVIRLRNTDMIKKPNK